MWARVGALVMRATAAVAPYARIHSYVDGPISTFFGTRRAAVQELKAILLCWQVRNLKVCWKKGCFGQSVEWIGITISPLVLRDYLARAITLSLSEGKPRISG